MQKSQNNSLGGRAKQPQLFSLKVPESFVCYQESFDKVESQNFSA